MPTVVVIQDGTELVRQKDADVADFFQQCFEVLRSEGYEYSWRFVADDAVGFLLDGITRDEVTCVIVASNALLSDRVERAMARHVENLRAYIASGGGLVLLYQGRGSLAGILPDELRPDVVRRTSPLGTVGAGPYESADDILLRYPLRVALDRLCDKGHEAGAAPLFWNSYRLESLGNKLTPVLVTAEKEVLLARTVPRTAERVVLCSIPLDFQRRLEPVVNAIRFACMGVPRRLLFGRDTSPDSELFARWLAMDCGTALRRVPEDGRPLDDVDAWLLSEVEVCLLPREDLDGLTARRELRDFLAAGGTLIMTEAANELLASRVTALVGRYAARQMAMRLYAELQAVVGWETVEYAFELRNILSALALLWRDPVNHSFRSAVSPHDLARLADDVKKRLGDPAHREDLSSCIALGECLCLLLGPGAVEESALSWMSDAPGAPAFDVALQIRAVRTLARGEADPAFLDAVLASLRSNRGSLRSPAPIARLLDATAMLSEADLLDPSPDVAMEVADLVADELSRVPFQPGVGWNSVETTADITRGLVVLLEHLEPASEASRRAARRLANAAAALREAMQHYEPTSRGVAWLARLVHALTLVERRHPIGLQRLASLRWPEGGSLEETSSASVQSLLAHLAEENKRLRDQERVLDALRLAARVGRVMATVLTLTVALAVMVTVIAVLHPDSVWDVLGNGAISAVFIGALVWVLDALDRHRLLAAPFRKVPKLVKDALPAVAAFMKLRKSER